MKDEKEDEEVTGPPDQFVGRDLLESYMVEYNHKPSNPLDRYSTLTLAITFGMELLPDFYDPDETDEEQIKKNEEKQKEKDKLYNKASAVLRSEIPSKRQIKYKYLDKGNRVYELKASDADPCEVVKDELETVMNNFTNQQHESHIPKLQEVHNQIFHVLTQTGIVPSINPTVEQMEEEREKEEMKRDWEKEDEGRE